MENNTLCNRHSLGVNNHTKMYVTYTRIYGWSDYGGESSYQPGYRLENMMWMTLLVYDYIIPGGNKMASGQIRMTPDTMRTRAGEYRTESENVQGVIEKMDSLLETLLTEWEGAASEAYANKFNELRPSFVAAKELIDDIATALDKTAEAVESTDSQIASQFSM